MENVHQFMIEVKRIVCEMCLFKEFILQDQFGYLFFDENGVVSVSKAHRLNAEHYVKDELELIYRLVHYVVNQSYLYSARTNNPKRFCYYYCSIKIAIIPFDIEIIIVARFHPDGGSSNQDNAFVLMPSRINNRSVWWFVSFIV